MIIIINLHKENVQKFALRVSTGQWTADYETLLPSLNTPSLATRRRRLKLSLIYNIIINNVNFPSNPTTRRQPHYFHRHINSSALVEPSAHSTRYQQSFFPSTITLWNSLSNDIVSSNSISSFKSAISPVNLNE